MTTITRQGKLGDLRCKARDLQLGDTVKLVDDANDMAWSTAIVQKIDADLVHFFRPYGTTADFSYTGGVICYVGIETFSRPLTDESLWMVLARQVLR